MKQNRWLSKYMWAAYVALAVFILGNYGLYDVIGMDESSFKEFANLILIVITGLGIFNSPTDKENF